MAFLQQLDGIRSRLHGRWIKTKRVYMDAAAEYAALATTLDDEPFNWGLIASAAYQEALCYQEAGEKQSLVKVCMKAARLYVRYAEFNFGISQTIVETWKDPLASAFNCFKIVYECLRGENKPNLAVICLMEACRAQERFDLWAYAADSYAEAVDICLVGRLSVALTLEATIKATNSYVRADRLDRAFSVVMKTEEAIKSHPFAEQVAETAQTKRQADSVQILHAIVLLIMFRHREAEGYAKSALEGALGKFFADLAAATRLNQPSIIDALLAEAEKQNYFTEVELGLLQLHHFLLSKSVEAAYVDG